MRIKHIRQGCYDKYHRCPGWAGAGFRYTFHPVCGGGLVPDAYGRKWWFRFHPECGTLVLPYYSRYLDPEWLARTAGRNIRMAIFDFRNR